MVIAARGEPVRPLHRVCRLCGQVSRRLPWHPVRTAHLPLNYSGNPGVSGESDRGAIGTRIRRASVPMHADAQYLVMASTAMASLLAILAAYIYAVPA